MRRVQVAARPLKRREAPAERPQYTELNHRTRRLLARMDGEDN